MFRLSDPPLGAILAGGASRRFGAPKPLAPVAGVRLVERVGDAVRQAGLRPCLITQHPDRFADLDLPSRPDLVAGAGPLGGIHAALSWAQDEAKPGALCVSCDLPFLAPGLLRELYTLEPESIVVAESTGRAGIEPLCAYYPVGCLPEIAVRIARRDFRLQSLIAALPTRRIPLARIRRWGDPERIFFNVNTPEDHQRAEILARG